MESMTSPFTFADFVAKFPPVSMPVTLGEDTHHVFGLENDPLPEEMVRQFILPLDPMPVDEEVTEFVPCFAFENTEQFIALVWWKAGLLEYEYILATFTPRGQLIQRNVIGFTRVNQNTIRRAVATINEEWEIFIAEGESKAENDLFDPTTSKTYTMEIMANGEIAV